MNHLVITLLAVCAIVVFAAPVHSEPREFSTVSYYQLHRTFIDHRSRMTDLQQEESWNAFSGKWVRWTGTVKEVSRTLGKLSVSVDMGIGSMLADVLLLPGDAALDKLRMLTKGQRIFFVGQLQRQPGKVFAVALNPAEIVSNTELASFYPLSVILASESVAFTSLDSYREVAAQLVSNSRSLTPLKKALRNGTAGFLPQGTLITLTGERKGRASAGYITESRRSIWLPNNVLREMGLPVRDLPD